MFADVNGIRLYYEVHGRGPVVVLAHGAGGNSLSWWQQVPALATRYKVVTFDHRGFGRSLDVPNGPGRTAFVEDLRALLDHLHIKSARLVAQSMGGWTCLGFAVRYPQRVDALVMVGTSGGIAEPEILDIYRRKPPPPDDIVERALGARFRSRSRDGAFLYAQILAMNAPLAVPLQTVLLSKDGPRAPELARLAIPTLFVMGSDDRTINLEIARRCSKLIPGARLKIVRDAGHSVYFERPRLFNNLLEAFFSATRKTARR